MSGEDDHDPLVDMCRALIDRWRAQAVDAIAHGEALVSVTRRCDADELERVLGIATRARRLRKSLKSTGR